MRHHKNMLWAPMVIKILCRTPAKTITMSRRDYNKNGGGVQKKRGKHQWLRILKKHMEEIDNFVNEGQVAIDQLRSLEKESRKRRRIKKKWNTERNLMSFCPKYSIETKTVQPDYCCYYVCLDDVSPSITSLITHKKQIPPQFYVVNKTVPIPTCSDWMDSPRSNINGRFMKKNGDKPYLEQRKKVDENCEDLQKNMTIPDQQFNKSTSYVDIVAEYNNYNSTMYKDREKMKGSGTNRGHFKSSSIPSSCHDISMKSTAFGGTHSEKSFIPLSPVANYSKSVGNSPKAFKVSQTFDYNSLAKSKSFNNGAEYLSDEKMGVPDQDVLEGKKFHSLPSKATQGKESINKFTITSNTPMNVDVDSKIIPILKVSRKEPEKVFKSFGQLCNKSVSSYNGDNYESGNVCLGKNLNSNISNIKDNMIKDRLVNKCLLYLSEKYEIQKTRDNAQSEDCGRKNISSKDETDGNNNNVTNKNNIETFNRKMHRNSVRLRRSNRFGSFRRNNIFKTVEIDKYRHNIVKNVPSVVEDERNSNLENDKNRGVEILRSKNDVGVTSFEEISEEMNYSNLEMRNQNYYAAPSGSSTLNLCASSDELTNTKIIHEFTAEINPIVSHNIPVQQDLTRKFYMNVISNNSTIVNIHGNVTSYPDNPSKMVFEQPKLESRGCSSPMPLSSCNSSCKGDFNELGFSKQSGYVTSGSVSPYINDGNVAVHKRSRKNNGVIEELFNELKNEIRYNSLDNTSPKSFYQSSGCSYSGDKLSKSHMDSMGNEFEDIKLADFEEDADNNVSKVRKSGKASYKEKFKRTLMLKGYGKDDGGKNKTKKGTNKQGKSNVEICYSNGEDEGDDRFFTSSFDRFGNYDGDRRISKNMVSPNFGYLETSRKSSNPCDQYGRERSSNSSPSASRDPSICSSTTDCTITPRKVSSLVEDLLSEIYRHSRSSTPVINRRQSFFASPTFFDVRRCLNCGMDPGFGLQMEFRRELARSCECSANSDCLSTNSERSAPMSENMKRQALQKRRTEELRMLVAGLKYQIIVQGNVLVKQLKRRDASRQRLSDSCDILTAHLQAISSKSSEYHQVDAYFNFS
ncbi:hypothetical protein LSTR_LSTR013630 [Laodelphax striatellus]|uniref:Uncharacterized protein n=1 Tax=Laodelphax striatellus TaxID=195883 RepID=A0A482WRH0_LAOST|nr:hypothetical protein LSTR_LSTR013630 [Laodelphax striatellus]